MLFRQFQRLKPSGLGLDPGAFTADGPDRPRLDKVNKFAIKYAISIY